MNIIKHYVCSLCDESEDFVIPEEDDAIYEPTVTCGGCGQEMVLDSQRYDFDDDDAEDAPDWDSEDDDDGASDEYVADIAARLGRGLQAYMREHGMGDGEVSVQARGVEVDLGEGTGTTSFDDNVRSLTESLKGLLGDDYEADLKDDPATFDWTFESNNRVDMPHYSFLIPDSFSVDYEADRGFSAQPAEREDDEDGLHVALFPGMNLDNEALSQFDGLMTKELHFALMLSVYADNPDSDFVGRSYDMAVEVSGEYCDSLIVQRHHALIMSEDDAFEFYIFPYHGNERFYLRFDLSACPGNLRGQMLEHTKRIAASFKFNAEPDGALVLLPEELLTKKVKGSEIADHFERALKSDIAINNLQIRQVAFRVWKDKQYSGELQAEATRLGKRATLEQAAESLIVKESMRVLEASNERLAGIWLAMSDVLEAQLKLGLSDARAAAVIALASRLEAQIIHETEHPASGRKLPVTTPQSLALAETRWREVTGAVAERRDRKERDKWEKRHAEELVAIGERLATLQENLSREKDNLAGIQARAAEGIAAADAEIAKAADNSAQRKRSAESRIETLRQQRSRCIQELEGFGLLAISQKRDCRARIAELTEQIAKAESAYKPKSVDQAEQRARKKLEDEKSELQHAIDVQQSAVDQLEAKVADAQAALDQASHQQFVPPGSESRERESVEPAPKRSKKPGALKFEFGELHGGDFSFEIPEQYVGMPWESPDGHAGFMVYDPRLSDDYRESPVCIAGYLIEEDGLGDRVSKALGKRAKKGDFGFKALQIGADKELVAPFYRDDDTAFDAYIFYSESAALKLEIRFDAQYSNAEKIARRIVESYRRV